VDVIREKRGIRTRKELADACRKSESWISKIYKRENGSFRLDDLNTIAEVLGVEVYHLFQPGFSKTMERRTGQDRRMGVERRIGLAGRHFAELRAEYNKLHPSKSHDAAQARPSAEVEIQQEIVRAARNVGAIRARQQAASHGADQPRAAKDRRKVRRPTVKPA
jgi:transcriptional regulator with XRE-family HTH domain